MIRVICSGTAACWCTAGLFLFIADHFAADRTVGEDNFVPYAPSEGRAAARCQWCIDINAETCLRAVPLLAVRSVTEMSVQSGIFIARNALIILRYHFKIYQLRYYRFDRFRWRGRNSYCLSE